MLGACAKANRLHFRGATYPWEAAFTGYDVCPGESYVRNEIHITADVIYLLKQYIYLTGNWKIFSEKILSCQRNVSEKLRNETLKAQKSQLDCRSVCGNGQRSACEVITTWDVLRETSMFWMSRVKWNQTRQRFVINDVMGPDEWHSPVNNSAFTNAIAAQALKFSHDVAKRLNICPHLASGWADVAGRMLVPIDDRNHFHPEFDGFDSRVDVVKQADAIMLGFPLGASTEDLTRNDLLIYERSTTDDGPAMTWGMFAINWLGLGEEKKARPFFLRQMKNVQPPFFIWSEQSDGSGATNFLTGMGGFLQSVVYGYFGIRVEPSRLTLNPTILPGGAREMTLNGLHYRHLVLRIDVTGKHVTISYLAMKHPADDACLVVEAHSPPRVSFLCSPGQSVALTRGRVTIWVGAA